MDQAARGVGPERVDQFLPQQAHRGRTEDDHSLLVEPNDTFVRPKVEQFGELQAAIIHLSTILPQPSAFNPLPGPSGPWKRQAIVGVERILAGFRRSFGHLSLLNGVTS